ncbi:MAG: hypothetical protein HZA78_06930 [Candidatus Schekmanbacteria bacterium]|nr:hypothetical protein [Candidatus Schekmanbacteria bacterium]
MANPGERPIAYYWHIIKSKKWTLIFVFIFTVAATTIGSLLWTPAYEATATLLLDYANPNPLDVQLTPGGGFSVEYMLTEKSIVESKNVALRVIDGLKLADNPSIKDAHEKSKMSSWQRRAFFWKRDKDIKQWLLDFLSESLVVMPFQESRVIAITFKSADPNFSAAVANAYAWAYTTYHLELKVVPLKESVEWFSKKVEELRRDVESKEKGMEEYKADKGVVAPDDRYNIINQKLSQINADLVQAENKYYETSIKMGMLDDLQEKGNYESMPEVLSSSLIQNLKVDKIRLEKELSELSNRVGTNHPHYLKMVAELQTVQTKMNAEIKNIVNAIVADYKAAKKRRETLREAVEDQKAVALKMNKETFDFNMRSMEAQTARKIYDTLLTKFSETALRGDINRTNVIIVDKAMPPSEPTTPKVILNILLSVVMGLPVGIGVVFVIEFLDNTVKSEEDIEIDLGMSVLGVIPKR